MSGLLAKGPGERSGTEGCQRRCQQSCEGHEAGAA